MNIERIDPVVLIQQSPDVERTKGDREPRRDKEEKPEDEESSASPPAAEGEQVEEAAPAEHKHAHVVMYEPEGETGVRKDEAEHDPTIDYKA